ncbi:MAG: flippase [Minisyncoccia bacterium]
MDLENLLFNNISPKQTFFKNSFWLLFSQILSRLFKLILVLVSARVLGPTGFGTFNYILSIGTLFFLFADWGINTLIIRDYQQAVEREKYTRAAFLFRILTTSLCLIAAILGLFVFQNPEFRLNFLVISIYLFVANIKDLFVSFLRAIQKMEKEFIVILVESFSVMAFSIFLILIYKNIISLSVGYLIGVLLSFITAGLMIKPFKNYFLPQLDKNLFKQLFINGLPVALFGLLNFILFSTDQIMLGKMRGVTEVGYYSLITKGILLINLLPSLIMIALFPYLSANINDKEKIKKITQKALIGFLALGFLIALLIFIFAPILPFFVGKQYEPSVSLAQFLSWIIVFTFPAVYLSYLYIAYNKQWLNFYLTAFCAIINLVLNFLLIPKFGMFAAAFTSILSQAANFGLLTWFRDKIIKLEATQQKDLKI